MIIKVDNDEWKLDVNAISMDHLQGGERRSVSGIVKVKMITSSGDGSILYESGANPQDLGVEVEETDPQVKCLRDYQRAALVY